MLVEGLAGGHDGELIAYFCEDFLDNSRVTDDVKIHFLVVEWWRGVGINSLQGKLEIFVVYHLCL